MHLVQFFILTIVKSAERYGLTSEPFALNLQIFVTLAYKNCYLHGNADLNKTFYIDY